MSAERIERVAKAICAERCAYMGEPACWRMREDTIQGNPLPWPAPACDDPGCIALAMAAVAADIKQPQPPASPAIEEVKQP